MTDRAIQAHTLALPRRGLVAAAVVLAVLVGWTGTGAGRPGGGGATLSGMQVRGPAAWPPSGPGDPTSGAPLLVKFTNPAKCSKKKGKFVAVATKGKFRLRLIIPHYVGPGAEDGTGIYTVVYGSPSGNDVEFVNSNGNQYDSGYAEPEITAFEGSIIFATKANGKLTDAVVGAHILVYNHNGSQVVYILGGMRCKFS